MTTLSVEGLPQGRTIFRTSLTRIWDAEAKLPGLEPLARDEWRLGDYVVVKVKEPVEGRELELLSGRLIPLDAGDLIMGALGSRFATLDATGSWEDVSSDGCMHLLTAGGLLGRVRSRSPLMPPLVSVKYRGHLLVGGERLTMDQCAPPVSTPPTFQLPVVLLTGTSMSAGKTTAARTVIRTLRGMGLRVAGAKLTGAGRFRDILAMQDAGAHAVFDFVDGGLPSTHCSEERFQVAANRVLALLAKSDAQVAVVEVGASPLEPYNGSLAIDMLRTSVVFHLLCASDPYAVLGALQAYQLEPQLVTGPTSNTEAGVQLVSQLTGLTALDLRVPSNLPHLDAGLRAALRETLHTP
ncbi:MAG: hypothetical protein WEA09_14835 [Gemmatimonadota bacterium]